mgnify:CR=1 FL=1
MEDHRMLVVAEFSKQKPISEIAAVLPRIFVGGHGLKLSAGDVSAWYYPDGIHLSYGRNIQHSRAAQIISWKDAALRIGQLLEEGHYASNTELAEALYHEQSVLADRLVLASRDAVDGYMPTIRSIKGVFPDQLDSVIELLRSPDSLETISKEFAEFYAGYKAGEPVSRFKIYTIDQIASGLIDLTLPRREYATEWTQVPQPAGFITEDEIDTLFVSGPPMSGGKQRVFDYSLSVSIPWVKGMPKKIFAPSLLARKSIVPESNLPWQKRIGFSIFCLSLTIRFGQKAPATNSGLRATI